MKILYDHQIFEHQRIGGVSRYFTEIIKHLPKEVETEVSVEYHFNEYLRDTDFLAKYEYQLLNKFLPEYNFKGQARITHLMEKYFPEKYPDRLAVNKSKTVERIRKGDFDIFHPTFFQDYYIDIMNGKPYVLTVHDMIIELFPEFINSPGFIKRKKRLVDNAAHIIAVSENTKQDIINVFGTSAEKISVTYHASSLTENNNKSEGLPDKYLLYVGDRRLGYKNFSFFVAAIQPILLENKDLYLVCTGDKFTAEEIGYFEALGIRDKVKIKFVEDDQMYGLYHNALMFVYPSYYEGFGIPILEAFQANCPVILADASCFREVAGDAALYFPPKSPIQLRENILSLLKNESLRKEYISKGNERLQKYSWEKSAESTVEIYKKVLESRNE